MLRAGLIGVVLVLAGLTPSVEAMPLKLSVRSSWDQNGFTLFSPVESLTPETFVAEGRIESTSLVMDWRVSGKHSGSVSPVLAVTNLLAIPQTFTISATVLSPEFPDGTLMGGSVGGAFSDADGLGGVVLTTNGDHALYTAMIDGAPVASLYPAPVQLSEGGAFLTGPIPLATFGTPPTLSAPGPLVGRDIGVQFEFELSPHDYVAFEGTFTVGVPEPSALVEACFGLAAGAYAIRRRPSLQSDPCSN